MANDKLLLYLAAIVTFFGRSSNCPTVAVPGQQQAWMSLPLTELVVIVAIVVIVSTVLRIRSRRNYPPGPRGIPILGYIPFLRGEVPRCFKEIANKYGSIFSIRLGTTDIVVLNDWKDIKEALTTRDKDLSARPSNYLWKVGLKNKGLSVDHGPLWKEEKQFTMKHIKSSVAQLEADTVLEIHRMLDYLVENVGSKIAIHDLFSTPLRNITTKMATGKDQFEEQTDKRLKTSVDKLFHFGGADSLVNFIPWLRFLPGHVTYHAFMESVQNVRSIVEGEIEKHKARFTPDDEPRNFIDAYHRESLKKANQDRGGFDMTSFVASTCGLFFAGLETTATTLEHALLYVALWPEIQTKVQQELDEVIGKSRLPEYKDHHQLPYTEATILEVHRFASIGPFALPHASIKDTEVGGFAIPTDTYILINFWALHNDENLWGDPEVFRPERFLDATGNVKKPEYLKPFSFGIRVCAGEILANVQVFLFFSTLLQKFSFHSVTGEAPLTLETTTGLTTKPKPFHLMAKPRF